MKILHATLGYLPAVAWGGPVKYVERISRELLRRKHEVTVASSNLLNKHERIESGTFERDVEGVRAVYLNTLLIPGWSGTTGPTMLTLHAMRRLWNEIQAADVVHVHGTRNIIVLAAAYFASYLQKPTVLQPHGTSQQIVNSIRLKRIYDRLFLHPLLAKGPRMIAMTGSEHKQIVAGGAHPHNIDIVPNGYSVDGFRSEQYRGCFRNYYNIPDDEQIILFLGRINRKKGTDLLVEAFAAMTPEDRRNTRLVIAGPDDGQLDEVKALVQAYGLSQQVLITGLLSGDDVTAAFVDADIFVLPCRTDTFPSTLLEACQAGTPIVLTETCEMAELLDGTAATVTPVDPPSIASAISNLLHDNQLRRHYAKGGPELIRTKLSISTVVDQLEEIYTRIV
jgi:glycosyltransferase involved in cell wall biosynthesis